MLKVLINDDVIDVEASGNKSQILTDLHEVIETIIKHLAKNDTKEQDRLLTLLLNGVRNQIISIKETKE